jgi:hypothetical protein
VCDAEATAVDETCGGWAIFLNGNFDGDKPARDGKLMNSRRR